jgi:YidC/Oxa1 family membrane protein insertase
MNFIKVLSDIMLQVLNFFYGICPGPFHNYGVAIILLTVAVKFALYPLTLQSTQQMAAMQKIQPKLQELQKKLKEDPQKMQKETMELYKKAGVNPVGGCLPMLLQIPFFIALFFALTSAEFKALIALPGVNTAFLWMPDLAKHDPTYIMVGLIGLSTYLSQLVMPQSAQTKQMLYIMPVFIAFISYGFPAGVQIYWTAQNLLTMSQQWYIMRKGA